MAQGTLQEQPTRILSGIHDDVELYPDRLVVRRRDLLSNIFRGDQILTLKEIAAVHLFECRFEAHGQLRLELVSRDRDAVVIEYNCDQHQMAVALKDAVEAALHHP